MRSVRRWLAPWLCVAAWMVSGNGPAVAGGTPAALTMAVTDSPYSAPVLVADALGFFAQEHVAVKLLHCDTGRMCLGRLLDGQAQLATVSDTPVAIASFSRHDFDIVATISSSGHDHQLVARADRGIRVPADLKGKRIGVLPGTSSHFFAESFLLFHGVSPGDVSLVPLDPQDAAGPLVRGDVDAAALFDPANEQALRRLGAQGIGFPTPSFFQVDFNLVSVPAARGARDEDLARVLAALRRAVELIRSDPARARAIVARAGHQDPRVLAEAWHHFDFGVELEQPLLDALEAQARWAMRDRLVPAGVPMPDYLDFIRSAPLRRVDPAAVRLVH